MGSDFSMASQGSSDGSTGAIQRGPSLQAIVRAGIIGGISGAVIIWIYEAVV